jgi:uncharacterized protein (TIGR02677 family)
VEEFKKKRFRYQCTPYTVELERMLERLERMGDRFGGSLERTQFDRLYDSLQRLERIVSVKGELKEKDGECAQLWDDIFGYFRAIVQNTSDYIAYLNSEQVEERMKTDAFLAYKDKFTAYLRDFIVSLQQTALKIQALLETLRNEQLSLFITKVVRHRRSIPRLDDWVLSEEEWMTDHVQKWESLNRWFLGSDTHQSEFHSLQLRTNETIRRLTRVVQRLGERAHHVRSRKRDYLHLAQWFSRLESIQDAHRLSAVVFGVFHTRHLFSDETPSEDLYTDVWEEKPVEILIKPRIRQYTEKSRPGAMRENQAEKEAALRAYLRDREREQRMILKYIENQSIRLCSLPVVEPYVRKCLLNWIGKAMGRKDGIIRTEFGQTIQVRLHRDQPPIRLRSEDGILQMPDATIDFLDDRGVR